MGYVGPAVIKQLACTKKVELFGYDNAYFGQCISPGYVQPERLLAAQYYGDVRDITSDVFAGIDSVVYLAAISNDPMGDAFGEPTRQINHECAVRCAKMARASGVRSFVFASSCSVYGKGDGSPRTESSEVSPLTEYARSKIAAERDLLPLAASNFRITCLRFATACGFSERMRLDLVLNDFVASAISSGRIVILSDGSPWRPVIHIADMARAIEWATQREDGGDFLVVNVGRNDCNLQVRDLAYAVAKQIPKVEVVIKNERPGDQRSYQVDFSLFASLAPRYLPDYQISDSVRDLISGLGSASFPQADLKQFIRLNVLKDLISRGEVSQSLVWRTAKHADSVASASA